MFPFLSLVVVITFVLIPSCWVIEAFYQVFPGILPQAAEKYRAANRAVHKWQKTEAEGFVLGVFGDGTKEEKLCLRARLQLRALQWCWVLPTEPERRSGALPCELHQMKSKHLEQLHPICTPEITRHAVGVTEQLREQLLTQFQLTLIS